MNQLPPSPFRNKFGSSRRKLILLLCTGNTCRSPMAAGYLRHLIQKKEITNVEVRSAGVMTVTGLRASQEAAQVMADHQIDLSRHRSSMLSPEVIRKADLILGMSPLHVQTALRMSDDARNKTFLLKEYARSDLKNIQIADPMGCTLEVFKKVFKEIRAACDRLSNMEIITGQPDSNPPEKAPRSKKGARKRQPAAVKAESKAEANGTAATTAKSKARTSAKSASAKASVKKSTKSAGAPKGSGKATTAKTKSEGAASAGGTAAKRSAGTTATKRGAGAKSATGSAKKKTRPATKSSASGKTEPSARRKTAAAGRTAKRKTGGAAGRAGK